MYYFHMKNSQKGQHLSRLTNGKSPKKNARGSSKDISQTVHSFVFRYIMLVGFFLSVREILQCFVIQYNNLMLYRISYIFFYLAASAMGGCGSITIRGCVLSQALIAKKKNPTHS